MIPKPLMFGLSLSIATAVILVASLIFISIQYSKLRREIDVIKSGNQSVVAPKGDDGDKGETGDRGEDGERGEMGKPGINFRDAWLITTEYTERDVVTFRGSLFIALKDNIGKDPSLTINADSWKLFMPGFRNMGLYNSTATYVIGDIIDITDGTGAISVYWHFSSTPSTGISPTDPTGAQYWTLIGSKGVSGATQTNYPVKISTLIGGTAAYGTDVDAVAKCIKYDDLYQTVIDMSIESSFMGREVEPGQVVITVKFPPSYNNLYPLDESSTAIWSDFGLHEMRMSGDFNGTNWVFTFTILPPSGGVNSAIVYKTITLNWFSGYFDISE